MISLERRLTLLVLSLLSLCWAVAGFTFYGSMRRAQEMELDRRLDVRLAWLRGAISVTMVEGGQIKFHKRREPHGAAAMWRITTHDGRILWASENWRDGRSMVEQSNVLSFGDPALPPLEERYIVSREEHVWERIPPSIRSAAEMMIPGLVVDRVDRSTVDQAVVFTIVGRDDRQERTWTLDQSGKLLKVIPGAEVDNQSTSLTPRYRMTGKLARLELRLTARTSSSALEYELARMAWGLKTIGPLTLMLTGALVAVSIRWQLRPLARVAEQAGRIGPGSLSERIGPVGSNAECVQLREAINGMLDRLAEGVEREHRFASTAAHELRTPLALLRTTIEVALRRERDASEYRAALAEIFVDVERLQKLVLGLLHLSRGAEHAPMTGGRPVVVAALLKKAAREHGPFVVGRSPAGDDLAIEGDEGLCLAALGNVLENAALYAPGSPTTIRVEETGSTVRLAVADRGPGIPEADRERIFQPLLRLNPTHSNGEPVDGFGLGLTVARATARAYGGDLNCRSRLDGAPGAEFIFEFRKAGPRD